MAREAAAIREGDLWDALVQFVSFLDASRTHEDRKRQTKMTGIADTMLLQDSCFGSSIGKPHQNSATGVSC